MPNNVFTALRAVQCCYFLDLLDSTEKYDGTPDSTPCNKPMALVDRGGSRWAFTNPLASREYDFTGTYSTTIYIRPFPAHVHALGAPDDNKKKTSGKIHVSRVLAGRNGSRTQYTVYTTDDIPLVTEDDTIYLQGMPESGSYDLAYINDTAPNSTPLTVYSVVPGMATCILLDTPHGVDACRYIFFGDSPAAVSWTTYK